ncbi:Chymotrypsin BI [Zootermopsis nevadensis]|uniref:Chymotrypsin BI n=1 Tax=Zootermopsis nevadensis TaxID=136037 RepID=A0A067R6D2_ZOONE|nr:Chymotrypsin BI [Zootermopsis nevadensis]
MKIFTLLSLVLLVAAASSKETRDWSNLLSLEPKLPHYPFVRGNLSPGSSRITGGQEADPHQFPHQVGILIETSSGTAFCGGSVLSNEWILTAAHCAVEDWSNLLSLEPKLPHYPFVRGNLSPGSSRITGGQEADPHQFPHQVGILIETSSGTAFCGGSVLSNEWILTAAHCAVEGSSFEVILGAHRVLEQEASQVLVKTTEKHVHPNWDSATLENDIALLKLPVKVELNDDIKSVRLPSRGQLNENFANADTTVSGWGKDSDSASTISPVLRFVQSPVISNLQCDIYYLGLINDGHICTSGSGGKSTCSGDSGGPLIITESDRLPTQIGLVSFGISLGCEIGWPPAFTRITAFLSWIESTTGIPIRD